MVVASARSLTAADDRCVAISRGPFSESTSVVPSLSLEFTNDGNKLCVVVETGDAAPASSAASSSDAPKKQAAPALKFSPALRIGTLAERLVDSLDG